MEKNIALAIEKEKEYYDELSSNPGKQLNFADYISFGGYDTIEEFLRDKNEFLLKNLDWDVIQQPEIDMSLTEHHFINRIPSFMWLVSDGRKYAFVSVSREDNSDLEADGYKIVKIGYSAKNGLILSFDGDLRVFMLFPETIDIGPGYFLGKLNDYLVSLGLDSCVDGNDILVGGFKVCGSASYTLNGMRNVSFQISFTNNTAEIERVCGTRIKRPGYIDTNLLNPITLKNKMLEWLQ